MSDRINIFPSRGAQTLMKGNQKYNSILSRFHFFSRASKGSPDRPQVAEEESRCFAAEI